MVPWGHSSTFPVTACCTAETWGDRDCGAANSGSRVPFCFIYPLILVYLLCQTCRLSANLRKNTQLLSDLRRGHAQGGGVHARSKNVIKKYKKTPLYSIFRCGCKKSKHHFLNWDPKKKHNLLTPKNFENDKKHSHSN